ncbi:bifunctional sterol desaturase/short chain dehydrogenase [Trichothermofontia sp.]
MRKSPFQNKVIALTGASGTLGQALIAAFSEAGAKIIALTTHANAQFPPGTEVVTWTVGQEQALCTHLQRVDILVINHGVNVYGDRTAAAIQKSYEVNTFSAFRLMNLFLELARAEGNPTVGDRTSRELWINTSEAEVSPAFSPLYELSKRTLGDLITLQRLDSPCVIRKLILGPFKSQLNPYGVMSAAWVARAIIILAQWNVRNIIVTINPITYLAFPIKELSQSLYCRCFSRRSS